MGEDEKILEELDVLRDEHRSIDSVIGALASDASVADQLRLQRLKKRKLWLKDRITHLGNMLQPDIIA